jgi:hypothetical protein
MIVEPLQYLLMSNAWWIGASSKESDVHLRVKREILDRGFGRSYMGIQSETFVGIFVFPLPHLAAPVDSISLSILNLEGIFANWEYLLDSLEFCHGN